MIVRTASLVVAACLVGCRSTDPTPPGPVAKGDRRFGVHVTTAADNDYGRAFQAARATGMDLLPFALPWTAVETPTGWDPSLLQTANAFFGAQGLPLYLTILSPINTNVAEVPAAYRGLPVDDPGLIAGFNRLLDTVRAYTPALDIDVLILGNEIEATLGADLAAWARYQTFFGAARAHAKQRFGASTLVGATIGLGALDLAGIGAAIDRLVEGSDLASVTYYPLTADFGVEPPSVAGADFAKVVGRFRTKPIYFQEIGYPTSGTLGSSDEKQRQFAASVFEAWDRHADRVRFLGWLWLTDRSVAETDGLVRYYGLGGPLGNRFGEYLRTLGLRTHAGVAKPAYTDLAAMLDARGW
ncbi:MAG: hypothetical protein ACKVZ0_22000 [Gemmatimonadales bacterium]